MRGIFYLITELDIGGAEKALFELATRLDRSRFSPVVGCLTGHGAIGERLERAGVEVVYFHFRGWWDLGAWFRLRREIRKRRPDVLHTFLFHANVAGRVAAIGLGIRKVISALRVEEPRRSHQWVERFTRHWVDLYTCVSESTRQHAHRRMGVPLARLAVIPNAVTLGGTEEAPQTPEEWNLPDEAPVVAWIGRIERQKDPLLLVRAAALVTREEPRAIFLIAGKGPKQAACQKEAARLGIETNVRWVGWIADVRPILNRMALLALPSRWEGMPNVVLEAMAWAKPVVGTNIGGTNELVVDGETGYLVPVGDAAALAAHIVALLRDTELARRMGQAGRQRVAERFSFAVMVEANQRLYAGS